MIGRSRTLGDPPGGKERFVALLLGTGGRNSQKTRVEGKYLASRQAR